MSRELPKRWLAHLGLLASVVWACAPADDPVDLDAVTAEVETAVWRFHAADTARDASAVIDLLWPEYEMLVDGTRLSYAEVAAGSREFMGSVDVFHTEWSDLRIIPLSSTHAISTFTFRDSIVTAAGELIRSQGPTTLVWERRGTTWKLRFGDADHYDLTE
ncbi:MAG: DUF4440 domain-containing protein [Gemmatimonadales bacterium]